jgi:hypothetical protein
LTEEWHSYLLTFGLGAVFELAALSDNPSSALFTKASEKGWTNWTPPPHGGSRKVFLKEAVARVYEEKSNASFANSPDQKAMREQHKERILAHKSEIRRRKATGDTRQITMSMERPMSEWENVFQALTHSSRPVAPSRPPFAPGQSTLLPPTPPMSHSGGDSRPSSRGTTKPASSQNHIHPALRSSRQTSASTTPTQQSHSHIHPAFRNDTSAFHETSSNVHPALRNTPSHTPNSSYSSSVNNYHSHGHRREPSVPFVQQPVSGQHPLQREILHSDLAENTADKAIFRIVEMGFTADQARHALKVTDMGDGLRIDRAVELLLRSL